MSRNSDDFKTVAAWERIHGICWHAHKPESERPLSHECAAGTVLVASPTPSRRFLSGVDDE